MLRRSAVRATLVPATWPASHGPANSEPSAAESYRIARAVPVIRAQPEARIRTDPTHDRSAAGRQPLWISSAPTAAG